MNFGAGKPITLVNRIPVEEKDDHGDDQVDISEVVVPGAFDPGSGSEVGDNTVDTRPAVLLPPGVEVQWTSAVRVDGITYEVDGLPQVWNSPFTGTQFGVRVPLKAQQRRPA